MKSLSLILILSTVLGTLRAVVAEVDKGDVNRTAGFWSAQGKIANKNVDVSGPMSDGRGGYCCQRVRFVSNGGGIQRTNPYVLGEYNQIGGTGDQGTVRYKQPKGKHYLYYKQRQGNWFISDVLNEDQCYIMGNNWGATQPRCPTGIKLGRWFYPSGNYWAPDNSAGIYCI